MQGLGLGSARVTVRVCKGKGVQGLWCASVRVWKD